MATFIWGCASPASAQRDLTVRDAIEAYSAARIDAFARESSERFAGENAMPQSGRPVRSSAPEAANILSPAWQRRSRVASTGAAIPQSGKPAADWSFCLTPTGRDEMLTLGTFALDQTAQSQPSDVPRTQLAQRRPGEPPEGYWRQDIWHQMGHEGLEYGQYGFWHGFKRSFWDLPNAITLTVAMGASITIRETGVDDTVASRTKGHQQFHDLDDTVQIIGNPATHFAGAGLMWLGSALMKDVHEHEYSKSLISALAVNGMTTILLKTATNTSSPDGDDHAWPSGHTSSAFTVAAVTNEYYGPWAGIPAFALAGLVGYQRIDSRVHDFSDVVFGATLGYIVGTSIAKDGKMQLPELMGMTVLPFEDPQTGAAGLALYKGWK